MATHHRLVLILALVALTGCQDAERLQAENNMLRQQLAEQTGKRQAEMEHLERQASIAAGCDWLIPLCPSNVTDEGRKALAAGVGGGGPWFWAAALLKLASLGVFLGIAIGLSRYLIATLAAPATAEADAARKTIQDAEGKAFHATQRAAKATQEAEAAQMALEATQEALAQAKIDLAQAKTETESVKAVKAALNAFK